MYHLGFHPSHSGPCYWWWQWSRPALGKTQRSRRPLLAYFSQLKTLAVIWANMCARLFGLILISSKLCQGDELRRNWHYCMCIFSFSSFTFMFYHDRMFFCSHLLPHLCCNAILSCLHVYSASSWSQHIHFTLRHSGLAIFITWSHSPLLPTCFTSFLEPASYITQNSSSKLFIPLSATIIWTCRFNLLHTAITFHHFFTVSLWTQNLPFQKILSSTLVSSCLSDWSHGSRPFTGFICSLVLCFSSISFCISYSYVWQTVGQLSGHLLDARKKTVLGWLVDWLIDEALIFLFLMLSLNDKLYCFQVYSVYCECCAFLIFTAQSLVHVLQSALEVQQLDAGLTARLAWRSATKSAEK